MTLQEKDESVERFLTYYLLYRRIDYSPEDIAVQLEFPSPQALYQRLHNDGFPVCPSCGKTRANSAHCQSSKDKSNRKTRTSGEAIELPPAKAAKPLFREALEMLRALVETLPKPEPKPPKFMDMQFQVEGLDTLKEYRQGELFVSS